MFGVCRECAAFFSFSFRRASEKQFSVFKVRSGVHLVRKAPLLMRERRRLNRVLPNSHGYTPLDFYFYWDQVHVSSIKTHHMDEHLDSQDDRF